MIDRSARNRLAEGIRHLAAGAISNIKFEERSLSSSNDPAVHAVFIGGPWFLYHDLVRYRLRGAHRLSPAVRREAARWILFLKSTCLTNGRLSDAVWLVLLYGLSSIF